MSAAAEQCAKCKTPVVSTHSWTLDTMRHTWRLCCLCTTELIQLLDGADAKAGEPQ